MTSLFDTDRSVGELVARLAALLSDRGQCLASAESCTGGLIAAACTDKAGSSAWFERGFVTYSNAAKQACLDVDADLLADNGAVSAPVVGAMLAGTLAHSPADWAIAVSGVAGPGGDSPEKPVGTVFIGWQARHAGPEVSRYHFDGDRGQVRYASVIAALAELCERVAAQ